MKPHRRRLFHLLHHDGEGGGPVVIQRLLAGLEGEWEQAVVSDSGGRLAEWCQERRIPYHRLPLFPLRQMVFGWPKLVALFFREKPDVIFLHGQWAGPIGAVASRLAGVGKTVYVAHCPAFYHSNRLGRALRNYVAETLPLRLCDRVVVLSSGSWRNYVYRRWGPEEKLVRISNGIDLAQRPAAESAQEFRARRGWRVGEFHAVFVGRLADQKRPDWMVEAWRRFLRIAPEFEGQAFLHFVGSGPERNGLGRLVRQLGLGASVSFEGEQSKPLEWISAADLVVMTSLYEGHSLVPLEAMLCSRPILAMKVDGVEDSIEDGQTGMLVPAGDVQAMAQRLAVLARNAEKRAALGREAGRRAAHWNWNHSLDQYRSLLCRFHFQE